MEPVEIMRKTLKEDIQRHVAMTLGSDPYPPRKDTYYLGLCYSVRDRLLGKWLDTQRAYHDSITKRVYYMSLEFLPGRFLMSYIKALGMEDECREAVRDFGLDLDELPLQWRGDVGGHPVATGLGEADGRPPVDRAAGQINGLQVRGCLRER